MSYSLTSIYFVEYVIVEWNRTVNSNVGLIPTLMVAWCRPAYRTGHVGRNRDTSLILIYSVSYSYTVLYRCNMADIFNLAIRHRLKWWLYLPLHYANLQSCIISSWP
jgi:hypothetical protein